MVKMGLERGGQDDQSQKAVSDLALSLKDKSQRHHIKPWRSAMTLCPTAEPIFTIPAADAGLTHRQCLD